MPKMLFACEYCGEIFRGPDGFERCRDHELHTCKDLSDKNARDHERLMSLVRVVLEAELPAALSKQFDKAEKRVLRRIKAKHPASRQDMIRPRRLGKTHGASTLRDGQELSVPARGHGDLSIEQEAMLRGSSPPAIPGSRGVRSN
jgi:hypothetical protein